MRIALIFLIANWINKASLRFGLKNLFTANLMGGGGVCLRLAMNVWVSPSGSTYSPGMSVID